MNTHIVSILVNHTDGTYMFLTNEAEVLDLMLYNDYGDITDNFGDCFEQIIKWEGDKDITLETYRSNSETYLEKVAGRLVDLEAVRYVNLGEAIA